MITAYVEAMMATVKSEADEYYVMLSRVKTHCDLFLQGLPLPNNPYKKISNEIDDLFLKHGRSKIVQKPHIDDVLTVGEIFLDVTKLQNEINTMLTKIDK
jgi:hypothetical protein